LFITLQQYVYTIRIGNAVGIMGEEIASAMQTGDVYALPAYSINEVQPKVSHYDITVLDVSMWNQLVFLLSL
jgi:hypothetical protein